MENDKKSTRTSQRVSASEGKDSQKSAKDKAKPSEAVGNDRDPKNPPGLSGDSKKKEA